VVKHTIKESDLNKAKTWSESVFLDNDLLLTERINEAPMPTEPRRMNFILIGLCIKGEVMYQLDTQKQVITPGDILIVTDRHVVDSYQHSPDMEGLCMMMSVNFFREIIQNVGDISSLFLFSRLHPVMRLEQKEINTFKEYFHAIKRKINDESNHFRKDLIRTLLLAMFYDLSNIIYRVKNDGKPQTRAQIIFTKFIKLVEQNFRQERRVSWYAEQLCITAKYLSETVKSASQRTPNEWIDNYVILELRVQLKKSTKNIKEIAEELNFPNQSFLGKYFKEHVGMSPSKYRRS
jgi:AraC-like DNA-binding protein